MAIDEGGITLAVSIEELQVQTQPASTPRNAAGPGAATPPKPDIHVELEKMRERYLRLQAD